jgi:hypothetical protein
MEEQNAYIESISSHLEFLGYTVTKEEKFIRAQGSGIPRLFFFNQRGDGLNFNTSYNLAESTAADRLGMLEWVNEINRASDVIGALINKETTTVTFFAWFPGFYEKKLFGSFFTTFSNDILRIARDERWNKYLK